MLSASEGSIYGHFGFSPATKRVRWEIERAQAMFLPTPPPAGELELVDAATARTAWPPVHDAIRRRSVGQLSARPGQWDGLSDDALSSDGPVRYVIHRGVDGEPARSAGASMRSRTWSSRFKLWPRCTWAVARRNCSPTRAESNQSATTQSDA